jgi:hypothetical protein
VAVVSKDARRLIIATISQNGPLMRAVLLLLSYGVRSASAGVNYKLGRDATPTVRCPDTLPYEIAAAVVVVVAIGIR